ncbi:hypothetical protein Y032_0230g2986 [Ancylostoma ceylanicum]|uniref:Uncharacterized protein n=1 Tax=Ancylostoma ceylanicum TaxID=53326 RepID=A0A016SGA2_9BILA|nr:hypothetical protein Y032_0230g2986 [Ancylostoma ceylanicum]
MYSERLCGGCHPVPKPDVSERFNFSALLGATKALVGPWGWEDAAFVVASRFDTCPSKYFCKMFALMKKAGVWAISRLFLPIIYVSSQYFAVFYVIDPLLVGVFRSSPK